MIVIDAVGNASVYIYDGIMFDEINVITVASQCSQALYVLF